MLLQNVISSDVQTRALLSELSEMLTELDCDLSNHEITLDEASDALDKDEGDKESVDDHGLTEMINRVHDASLLAERAADELQAVLDDDDHADLEDHVIVLRDAIAEAESIKEEALALLETAKDS
ncbi:MAG: hypothetical protein ACREYC_13040 [Gammaproteobacteria bacterium]